MMHVPSTGSTKLHSKPGSLKTREMEFQAIILAKPVFLFLAYPFIVIQLLSHRELSSMLHESEFHCTPAYEWGKKP